MLTLDISGALFWCLHYWLWTSEDWMGPFRKFPKINSGKIWKSRMLGDSKGFHQHARFSKENTGFYPNLNNLSLKQIIIRVWYFLWLILLFDTQLKQDLQIYTKFLSSSSYSCLPIKICESEVYAKHSVQPLDTHYVCLFSEKSQSWYTCSHQHLYKISDGKNRILSHPYHLKRFHNPPATQEIKL